MTSIQKLFFPTALLFSFLFLSADIVNAQSIEPRSYLWVEVRDLTGHAVGEATVKVSRAGGNEVFNDKTNKEGVVNSSFHRQYEHYYEIEITKPGYLPYQQVFFPRFLRQDLVALTESFPGAGEPVDYTKGPPIKVALLKTPVTNAETRAAAAEAQKRQLLLAVKRSDAASVSRFLQAGVNANITDAKGVPAIAWAAFAGDPETIRLLLAARANVRNRNSLAHQALLIYLAEGLERGRYARRGERNVGDQEWPALQADIVHRLIVAGVDVNANDSYRGTVLNKAIAHVSDSSWLATIKELIAAKANVTAADESGQTPLMLAAANSEGELVPLLLAAGAKPSINAKDKNGRTALINAAGAYRDSSHATIMVLLANGAKVNDADNDGVTSLMLASKASLAGLMRTLLKAGADLSVNAKDKQGQTALMYFVDGFNQSAIAMTAAFKVLLAAGANVNATDANGQSALMHAVVSYFDAKAGHVQMLIAAGANVNQIDVKGQTALMLAARISSVELVNALLKGGAAATINTKDKEGNTALLSSLAQLSYAPAATIKALIAAGANVDAVNAEGQTPLILAAQRNNLAMIKTLLEAHASINVRDKSGKTALMYIHPDGINPTSEIVQILIAAGAALTNPDNDGETPLMEAASKDYNLAIVEALLATDAKTSLNAKDHSGMTALMRASCYAPDMVKPLLAAGAKVNEVDNSGETALMCSANQWRDSALGNVKGLIAAGADVNATDKRGRSTLMHVAKDRDWGPAMVKALITSGANVNVADASGQTPLMYLAEGHSVEMLQILIAAGASLEAKDKDGRTALLYAIPQNFLAPPIVKALIAVGVNVDTTDNSGMTPLMFAARTESPEVIKALLEAGAAVNAKDNQGQTALMLAAGEDNYHDATADAVNALIAAKADVNAINQYGQTPLMLAAKTGYTKTVQSLLAAGAVVNAKDNLGQTALLFATDESRNSTFKVVELLLAAKANVNDINKREQTALMLAAIRGGVESVTMLLKAGTTINVKDNEGLTPLMYAAWGGRPPAFDILTALLKAGAKVNDVSQDGETALMLAARHGTADVLQTLLAAHATINAKTKKGQTALMYVIEGYNDNKLESAKLLLKSGADVSIKDNEGQTALTMARKLGQEAIVKLLEEAQHSR